MTVPRGGGGPSSLGGGQDKGGWGTVFPEGGAGQGGGGASSLGGWGRTRGGGRLLSPYSDAPVGQGRPRAQAGRHPWHANRHTPRTTSAAVSGRDGPPPPSHTQGVPPLVCPNPRGSQSPDHHGSCPPPPSPCASTALSKRGVGVGPAMLPGFWGPRPCWRKGGGAGYHMPMPPPIQIRSPSCLVALCHRHPLVCMRCASHATAYSVWAWASGRDAAAHGAPQVCAIAPAHGSRKPVSRAVQW